jgi:hypothetical protein
MVRGAVMNLWLLPADTPPKGINIKAFTVCVPVPRLVSSRAYQNQLLRLCYQLHRKLWKSVLVPALISGLRYCYLTPIFMASFSNDLDTIIAAPRCLFLKWFRLTSRLSMTSSHWSSQVTCHAAKETWFSRRSHHTWWKIISELESSSTSMTTLYSSSITAGDFSITSYFPVPILFVKFLNSLPTEKLSLTKQ